MKLENKLIEIASIEAADLQRKSMRVPKGIVSTQVAAVLIILARIIKALDLEDTINEKL